MRKLILDRSVICYYIKEDRFENDMLGRHPVAAVMLAHSGTKGWCRGIAVCPLTGDQFEYDGYRALAYKRLAYAVRHGTDSKTRIKHDMPAMARFFSADPLHTSKVLMLYTSESDVLPTSYEEHIVKAIKPGPVRLLGSPMTLKKMLLFGLDETGKFPIASPNDVNNAPFAMPG